MLNPSDALQIYLLYYHFSIDNKQAAAVTASDFAHEVDLIGAYALNDNVSFTGVLGWTIPRPRPRRRSTVPTRTGSTHALCPAELLTRQDDDAPTSSLQLLV